MSHNLCGRTSIGFTPPAIYSFIFRVDSHSYTLPPPPRLSIHADVAYNPLYTFIEKKKQYAAATHVFSTTGRAITVVDPTSVRIVINGNPGLNVLEEGRVYDVSFVLIYVDPESGRDYEIVQSDGFDYDMDQIGTHFTTVQTYATEDKYKLKANTIAAGTSRRFTFRAKFLGNNDPKTYTPPHAVTGILDVEIFAPIIIVPPTLLLPLGTEAQRYAFDLAALGGSYEGSKNSNRGFSWTSDDESVVTIASTKNNGHFGVITPTALGNAVVKACDIRACDDAEIHSADATVNVKHPTGITFPPITQREVLVGDEIAIPIAIFDDAGTVFDDCRYFDLVYSLTFDPPGTFVRIGEQPDATTPAQRAGTKPLEACRTVTLKALKKGRATMVVTLKGSQTTASASAEVDLRSYEALRFTTANVPTNPMVKDGESINHPIVSIGSSVELLYEGGPAPLSTTSGNTIEELSFDNAGIDYTRTDAGFKVVCNSIGIYTLTLQVGSKAFAGFRIPVLESISTVVECANPATVELRPMVGGESTEMENCPQRRPVAHHWVPGSRDMQVEVRAFTADNRTFFNFSSANIQWTSQAADTALVVNPAPSSKHRIEQWDVERGTGVQIFTVTTFGGSEIVEILMEMSVIVGTSGGSSGRSGGSSSGGSSGRAGSNSDEHASDDTDVPLQITYIKETIGSTFDATTLAGKGKAAQDWLKEQAGDAEAAASTAVGNVLTFFFDNSNTDADGDGIPDAEEEDENNDSVPDELYASLEIALSTVVHFVGAPEGIIEGLNAFGEGLMTTALAIAFEAEEGGGQDEGDGNSSEGSSEGNADTGEDIVKTIKDNLFLRIVQQTSVKPKELILFNHGGNTATMDIVDGSSVFHVATADGKATRVVKYVHDARLVTVKPKKIGSISLSVSDNCTRGLSAVLADVYVSDITSDRIETSDFFGLVEVGQTINVSVCVFTKDGVEFPESQFPLIDLQSHSKNPEIAHVSDVLGSADGLLDGCEGQRVELFGKSDGITNVHFSVYGNKETRIKSRKEAVNVYPLFDITPNKIVLIPGAAFELKHVGGPGGANGVALRFASDDSNVIKTDNRGFITAGDIGTAQIEGWYEKGHGNKLCDDFVDVEVKLLDGISIFAGSTNLIEGTTIDVFVEGRDGDIPFPFGEGPFSYSWTEGDESTPFRFEWNISKPVVEIHSQYSGSDAPSVDFSTAIEAQSPGVAVLSVKVTDRDGNFPSGLLKAGASNVAELEFEVFRKLKITGETPDGQSKEKLFLPVNATSQITTSLDETLEQASMRFSVFNGDQGAISVSPLGLVTALNPGVAVVTVSHIVGEVNQTVDVFVEVESVHSLSVKLLVPTSPYSNDILLIGVKSQVLISMHARTGRSFASEYNRRVTYILDREDGLLVDGRNPAHLAVTAQLAGEAVLRVSLPQSRFAPRETHREISAYIKLRARTPIEPADATLHVGHTPCFKTFLTKINGPVTTPPNHVVDR